LVVTPLEFIYKRINFLVKLITAIIVIWAKCATDRVTRSASSRCARSTTKLRTTDCTANRSDTRRNQGATTTANDAATYITNPPANDAAADRAHGDARLIWL
jgi:hypothetical protein